MSAHRGGKRSYVPLMKRARCLECGKKGVSQKSWDCQFCAAWWGDPDAYTMARHGPDSLAVGFYWAKRPADWGEDWTVVEKREAREWMYMGDNRICQFYEIGTLGPLIATWHDAQKSRAAIAKASGE